jgi:type IV pilus biogenesis protein CpaD/CtpE
MRFLKVIGFAALVLLAACAARPPGVSGAAAQPRPSWIENPGDGVSSSAAFHVRGKQAQEELAISRAREEFAKRYGVTISSDHDIAQSTVNDRTSSISEKSIREEVRDREVKAQVREKWVDPASGALWVWIVPAD